MDFLSQEAETNAKNMELQIGRLQKNLEEKNEQLQASTSSAEKVLLFHLGLPFLITIYYYFIGHLLIYFSGVVRIINFCLFSLNHYYTIG